MRMQSRSGPRQARREASGTVSEAISILLLDNSAGVCTVLAGQTND